MPIRPDDRARYPAEWPEISAQIRARAEDRCECVGECGDAHGDIGERCDAPNRRIVQRHRVEPARWKACPINEAGELRGAECFEDAPDNRDWQPPIRIVLTVAHLDRTPEHCDPANLRAFCQRCHLCYDAQQHAASASATRRERRDNQSGQVSLWGRR